MESKNYSTIIISSILVFALIATATTGISTTFESVLAQGENGSLQDENIGMSQISNGNKNNNNQPESIHKKLSKKRRED